MRGFPHRFPLLGCTALLLAGFARAEPSPPHPSNGGGAFSLEAPLDTARQQLAAGLPRDAVTTLSGVLPAADASQDVTARAEVRALLGSALVAAGDRAGARRRLDEALTLAQEAKAPALEARVEIERGSLFAIEGDFDAALASYAAGEHLAGAAGEQMLALRARANAARARLDAGRSDAEVRSDLAMLAHPDNASLPLDLRLHVGRSALRLAERTKQSEDVARAHQLLDGARIAAEAASEPVSEAWAQGYLGRLYEIQGRSEEALNLSRRAAFLAQGSPEGLYRWNWQIGRLLAVRGELPAAIEAYRTSASALGEIRQELVRSYGSGISFHDDVAPVYLELADLLLRSAPEPSAKAAHEARLLEVRETVEQLKAQELRDYFRDDCVDAVGAHVERLDQVSKQAAVIYPVLLPDRLELLVTLPSGMLRVTVPGRSDELEAEVAELRRLLEKRTTLEFLPHAQRLYDRIVRPFATQLEGHGITTLVFVPDGLLRTIPMGALHDGEKFLLERYALAVTPGLSLTDPRPLTRQSPALLLGGLSQSVQGFSPLPYVTGELRDIHALYGGDVLLDEAFREDNVEQSLTARDMTIVHLASHAQFSEDAQESFVLTWDGHLGLDRLGELIGYTRLRERPIELLALSACETAEGSERAALGLAGVAVKAGARSALGTLWSVNDEAASRVMTRFYQELRDPNVSKAEALQRAQLALLEDATYRHPFFWSPFLMINNWL